MSQKKYPIRALLTVFPPYCFWCGDPILPEKDKEKMVHQIMTHFYDGNFWACKCGATYHHSVDLANLPPGDWFDMDSEGEH